MSISLETSNRPSNVRDPVYVRMLYGKRRFLLLELLKSSTSIASSTSVLQLLCCLSRFFLSGSGNSTLSRPSEFWHSLQEFTLHCFQNGTIQFHIFCYLSFQIWSIREISLLPLQKSISKASSRTLSLIVNSQVSAVYGVILSTIV